MAAKNLLVLATTISLGFSLVGCKSDLSAANNVDGGLKVASTDLASSASLQLSPLEPSAPNPEAPACRTAPKIQMEIYQRDVTTAVFRRLESALVVPGGVAMTHYTNAQDMSNYVAVAKKGFYANIADKRENSSGTTSLSSLIMQGRCSDYVFKRTYSNLIHIDSKECGRNVALLAQGQSSQAALYFKDGYVFLKHTTNSSGGQWDQWTRTKSSSIDISSENQPVVEVFCEKYDEAGQKRMDGLQHQMFHREK